MKKANNQFTTNNSSNNILQNISVCSDIVNKNNKNLNINDIVNNINFSNEDSNSIGNSYLSCLDFMSTSIQNTLQLKDKENANKTRLGGFLFLMTNVLIIIIIYLLIICFYQEIKIESLYFDLSQIKSHIKKVSCLNVNNNTYDIKLLNNSYCFLYMIELKSEKNDNVIEFKIQDDFNDISLYNFALSENSYSIVSYYNSKIHYNKGKILLENAPKLIKSQDDITINLKNT